MNTVPSDIVLPFLLAEQKEKPSDEIVWLALECLAEKRQIHPDELLEGLRSINGTLLYAKKKRWYVAYKRSELAEFGIQGDFNHDQMG